MTFGAYVKTKVKLIGWLILGGIVMTYFVCDSCADSATWYIRVSAFTISTWVAMWLGNEYIAVYLDEKIHWTKEPIKRFVTGIMAMLLYTISMIFLLVKFFEQVLDFSFGAVSEMLYGTILTTFVITLFMTSRSFLFNWKNSAIDAEKLQKESISAQYESLKSQVNPHFLFNSLNALSNLVYEDQDKAVKFIKQLSEVYRYVLDTRDKEVVSMDEEKKFLDSYLFLQQIRFGNKLNLNVKLLEVKSMVAPLVLQMLIENAIKHNIVSEENPLLIRVYEEAGYIVVENNLQKKKVLQEDSPGLGLENIRKRYEFLSDKKVEVAMNEKFVVKLPIIPVAV